MTDIAWLESRPGIGARFTNALLRATRAKTPLDVDNHQALIDARQKLDKLDTLMAKLRRKSSLPFTARESVLAGIPVMELTVRAPLAPATDGILLFIHGGGFFFRSLHSHMLLAARIAEQAGIRRVILPLYSLAPESLFPVARDECRHAYGALLASGIDPDRLAIAADSAGAALALGMLVKVRDEGLAMPRAVALLSPMLDLGYSGDAIVANAAHDPMFGGQPMPPPTYYLGNTDPRSPECSPLFADLSGLPALYVQVGSTERLLDDSLRLADSRHSGNLPVAIEVWKEMPHVFQAYDFREAAQARRHIAAFFRNMGFARPMATGRV
ncbi:alpha/beta hydrolase fold domain-containing protein [Sphingomonas sp.]|uniref:alpha/beta hydrolase fold domain-containing protein n=1 Tax=Sphingomonas sp. TaxID=28214 RepID=UPI001EC41079|nr:alpha/beta hydrolase fold domain-containing protein [Sphingomonas sp.]MBX3593402.1 alpha/beta hydrolase fold domain-containing protein [Sphingomonas sp.]